MKLKREWFLPAFIAALAGLKYFYQAWVLNPFELDQEFLAMEAWRFLREHTATLIGAHTSQGGMYIAPYYTYFITGLMALTGFNPHTINLTSAFWATLTAVALYFIGKKLFSKEVGLIAAILATLSIGFLSITDIPPLVVPLGLVSLLTFYCLSQLEHDKRLLFAAVTLAGIGMNLHFTGLYLAAFIVLWIFIIRYRVTLVDMLKSAGILIFSFLPLIAFDLRHNFLNSRNFITFILTTNGLKVLLNSVIRSYFLASTYFGDLINNFQTHNSLVGSLALAAFIIYFIKLKPKTSYHKLLLAWIIFPVVINGFYTGALLPYYYIFHHPQMFLVIGLLLAKLTRNLWGRTALLTLAFLYLILNLIWLRNHANAFSLNNKMAAFELIRRQAGTTNVNVSFTVEHSRRGGMDFLRNYYGFDSDIKPDRPTYTIVSPFFYERLPGDYNFGEIGVILPKTNSFIIPKTK